MTAVEIRRLTLAELERVTEIDISEEGEVNYRVVDGRLEKYARRHRRPHHSPEDWRPLIAEWRALVEQGAVAFGEFAGGRLVGIAILRLRLTDEMSQLAVLYVDRAHRRMGLAGALVDEVESAAKQAGMQRLYVSATPSDSAVPFYLGRGFVPVAHPHPTLLALEPDDVHMTKELPEPLHRHSGRSRNPRRS